MCTCRTPLPQASFPAKEVAQFGSEVPMKRPGQPKEVAAAFGEFELMRDASFSGSRLPLRVVSPAISQYYRCLGFRVWRKALRWSFERIQLSSC